MGFFDSIKRKLGYDIINNNGINEIYVNRKYGKTLGYKFYNKNGVYHGKYYKYNNWDETNHWIQIEINYKDGKKHGIAKYFWKKHVSAEGNFTNGKETGIIKKYFRYDDELKDIKLHPVVKESADLDRGIYKVFSLDGKILETSEIDGVKFEEGSSSSSDGYWGGVYPIRNGLCQKWFENGKLKEKGYWGKNNTKSSIYNLCHRKGEHIQYYKNGKEFKIGEWADKQPVGIHKFYYPSGKLEFEVEFETVKMKSQRIFSDIEGIIKSPTLDYFKVKSVSEKWYNEDGSLMSANEIIVKGGDIQTISSGILDQQNFAVINGFNFRRMGDIAFYASFYSTYYSLGHSYSVQN